MKSRSGEFTLVCPHQPIPRDDRNLGVRQGFPSLGPHFLLCDHKQVLRCASVSSSVTGTLRACTSQACLCGAGVSHPWGVAKHTGARQRELLQRRDPTAPSPSALHLQMRKRGPQGAVAPPRHQQGHSRPRLWWPGTVGQKAFPMSPTPSPATVDRGAGEATACGGVGRPGVNETPNPS